MCNLVVSYFVSRMRWTRQYAPDWPSVQNGGPCGAQVTTCFSSTVCIPNDIPRFSVPPSRQDCLVPSLVDVDRKTKTSHCSWNDVRILHECGLACALTSWHNKKSFGSFWTRPLR